MCAPAGAASGPSALREESTRNSLGHSIERLRPFKKKGIQLDNPGDCVPLTRKASLSETWGILIVVNGKK